MRKTPQNYCKSKAERGSCLNVLIQRNWYEEGKTSLITMDLT